MTVAAVLPAHNEAKHITQVVKETLSYVDEVIVVDDGSLDKTSKLALNAGATVLTHCTNLGKGAAVKTGCDYAMKHHEKLILMDSDGQHRASDIPRFLKELEQADIVFGSRKPANDAPLLMTLGNHLFTFMNKLLFSIPVKDSQSGFRAFRSNVYPKLRWNSTGYEMESEMIYRADGLQWREIFIDRIYLDKTKGTTVLHGFGILLSMLRWKLFGG